MSDELKIHCCDDFDELISLLIDSIKNCSSHSKDSTRFSRIEIEIPQINVIDWLYYQKSSEKIYWCNKDNSYEISAVGIADKVSGNNCNDKAEKIRNLIKNLKNNETELKYFGGFRFDTNRPISNEWKLYGDFVFILPKFELIRRKDKFYFACNFKTDSLQIKEDLIKELNTILFSPVVTPEYDNKVLNRVDSPDKSGWQRKIEKAKEKIHSGDFDKIVLSRKTELDFEKKINPEILLKKLKSNSDNCYLFLLQINESSSFMGATPEKLFTRKNKKIECEAIAGTIRRGDDKETDKKLGNQLLNSKKDIKEHQYVIKSITESISDIVKDYKESQKVDIDLLKLSNIQHLVSKFSYDLKENINDFDLLKRFNPTAAVGGYPKKNALKAIDEIEDFDRGWYASPIGWIGNKSTEFIVGIRSGLINNNRLLLYSGAGIIESSDVDSEWNEIENKLSNFLDIII